MKRFILVTGIALFAACTNPTNKDAAGNEDQASDTTTMHIQIPESGCYIATSGEDTFGLKIEVFPNVVTGVLRYDFHEKDRSNGNIDGKLHGDTLLALYTYMSEGTTSTRQVAFLIKDSVVFEGSGEMEEKDGRMLFKDLHKLDFSSGLRFRKVECLTYDPANQTNLVTTASQGGEPLYQYQWNLAELQGRPVDPSLTQLPFLLFSPGHINRVSGNAGCNRLTGTFTLSGQNAIAFSKMVTTKMACPNGDVEKHFLDALGQINHWQISSNELLLGEGETVLMKFKGASTSK